MPAEMVAQYPCYPSANGILNADVHGDTVILKDDTVERNCGVRYKMQVSWLNNSDTLIWEQIDYGQLYGCSCHFNLSVTVDSLNPGSYTTMTYFTDSANTYLCYVGSIQFVITHPNQFPALSLSGHHQSSCFPVAVKDLGPSKLYLNIYPNPVHDFIIVKTNMLGDKFITISDLQNRCIIKLSSNNNENKIYVGNLSNSIYILTVKNFENSIYSKFCKR